MKKLLFYLFALAILTSCDDDKKTSVMPTFHGFKVTWNNLNNESRPSAGDTIRITAAQKTIGEYIYNANYHWQVSTIVNGKDSVFSHNVSGVVYDHQNTDPYINYIVPKGNNGTLRVNFNAEYSFSSVHVKAPNNNPSHLTGYYGYIDCVTGSLFGQATGSCQLNVNY